MSTETNPRTGADPARGTATERSRLLDLIPLDPATAGIEAAALIHALGVAAACVEAVAPGTVAADQLVVAPHAYGFVIRTRGAICGCLGCRAEERALIQERTGDWVAGLMSVMVVCPRCGDKRCPHAAHHDNACAG